MQAHVPRRLHNAVVDAAQLVSSVSVRDANGRSGLQPKPYASNRGPECAPGHEHPSSRVRGRRHVRGVHILGLASGIRRIEQPTNEQCTSSSSTGSSSKRRWHWQTVLDPLTVVPVIDTSSCSRARFIRREPEPSSRLGLVGTKLRRLLQLTKSLLDMQFMQDSQ